MAGPTATMQQVQASAARALLMSKPVAAKAGVSNVLDSEEVQRFGLQASGFAETRPALGPGESGERDMRMVPFQVCCVGCRTRC